MRLAEKVAESKFWNQVTDSPQAPETWDKKYTIPIKCLSNENRPDKGCMHRLGFDAVVAGFWWACAQDVQRARRGGG